MWLPNTDSVVVVQCNPSASLPPSTVQEAASHTPAHSEAQRLAPLRQLLLSRVEGLEVRWRAC
jgi:hypothetical protein